jgi:hypothetical protein
MNKHEEYIGPKVSFRHSGSTYVVLTFLKMKNCPVSAKQISECFVGYFRKPSDAEKSLQVLKKNGCAEKNLSGNWHITQKGRDVIRYVARTKPESVLIRGFGM